MSEAPRYKAIKLKTERGNVITYSPHGPDFVPADAYDQLLAELAALKAGQEETIREHAEMFVWLRDKCHLFEHYRAMKWRPDAFENEVREAMKKDARPQATPAA